MEKELRPNENLKELVTVGGWYETTEGRWAEIQWRNGQNFVTDVRDSLPSREERAAEIRREFEEQIDTYNPGFQCVSEKWIGKATGEEAHFEDIGDFEDYCRAVFGQAPTLNETSPGRYTDPDGAVVLVLAEEQE